jgi:molybdate transport system ATP-binding protein
MMKDPPLVIFDEPCQGLDAGNRDFVLNLLSRIGEKEDRSIIYVTHYREEIPEGMDRELRLG